jgi:hypothetical protein
MKDYAANYGQYAKYKKTFEERHGKVWVNTDICAAFKKHSPTTCHDCKHFDQCYKYIAWMISIMDGHSPDKYLEDPLEYVEPFSHEDRPRKDNDWSDDQDEVNEDEDHIDDEDEDDEPKLPWC